ncbi:hypothetical protein MSG28_009483 [Choristoneura fumiferana]|uniref:Uncharacterized protein n=1 Tax=Choristoneura fumiferana TaxID=7141 RepID=A0ACC0JBF3_CHOFU|nr:hypothetical protein MSG28_009483 [Choristoneura fumiferana]
MANEQEALLVVSNADVAVTPPPVRCGEIPHDCDRIKCFFTKSGWMNGDAIDTSKVAAHFDQFAKDHPEWTPAVNHVKTTCLAGPLPAQGTQVNCPTYDIMHCALTGFFKLSFAGPTLKRGLDGCCKQAVQQGVSFQPFLFPAESKSSSPLPLRSAALEQIAVATGRFEANSTPCPNAQPSQWSTGAECTYPRQFAAACPICPESCFAPAIPYGSCNACRLLPQTP